ncbi:Glycosyl transferase family 2 [Williamsia serinedens]|uniref:Glycosyl transferase family 2 n=2 Tax=Williamsia serinedens TaxID=391736 RepID=A0ABT1GZP9_9NOCA|nr:Glycosyl transferase family 2 [Williamsia serinedens]
MVRRLLKDTVLGSISDLDPLTAVRDRYPQFRPYPYDAAYETWMREVEPTTFLAPIGPVANPFGDGPMFSIVVPTFDTPQRYLNPLVDSVLAQTFHDLELVLADASTDPDAAQRVATAADRDPRIRYVRLDDNGGISRNTNVGITAATGSFVAFVDHDDTLAPQALNEVAHHLLAHPDTEIVYTDEDKITDDGRWRHSPHRKPRWSPHHYLCCNYTSHLSIVRRDLLAAVGGLDPECDGAQDYELILRLHSSPGERVVAHIPKVLYHWRTAAGSTAAVFEDKPYVREAGRRALERALDERGMVGQVRPIEGMPGWYDVTPGLRTATTALLVVVGDRADERATALLRATDTSPFRTVTPVGVGADDEIDAHVSGLDPYDVVAVVRRDVVPDDPSWLQVLAGAAQMEDVRAVAPKIVGASGRVEDMGVVEDAEGRRHRLFEGARTDAYADHGSAAWIRDVDALSGAVTVSTVGRRSETATGYDVVWSPVTVTARDREDRPRLSVCVPLYRNASTVERCLRSILDQDLDDAEVVVVDDASDDEGASRAQAMLRPGDRVVVNPVRLGAAGNHNRCLDLARGEFVQFVHGDDELLPGALTDLVSAFDDDTGMVFARRRVVDASGEAVDGADVHTGFRALSAENAGDDLVEDMVFRGVMRNWFGEPSNVMIRLSDARDVGGFRPELAQTFDLDLWLRLSVGRRVAFVDREVCVRHDDGNTLSAHNERSGRGWLDHTRLMWGLAVDPRVTTRARRHAAAWLLLAQPPTVGRAVRGTSRWSRLLDVVALPFTEIERTKRITRTGGR